MAENIAPTVLEIDLGEHGDRLSFKTGEELHKWNNEERNKWLWLKEAGHPITDMVVSARNEFSGRVDDCVDRWRRNPQNQQEVTQTFAALKSTFDQYCIKRRVLISTHPEAAFIFELREKRSDRVAAGAYAGILNAPIQTGGQTQSEFFEGIIEAFLFKRDIDWTAKGHQQALNRLKKKYDDEIAHQNERFTHLEEKNRQLNEMFDAALKEKNELLQNLHQDQTGEFTKLIEKHLQNLLAIEKTYDQKLALRRPVKYWEVKEGYHRKRAIVFGVVTLVSALAAAGGLVWLAYEYLGKLQPTENPKHWQIGLLGIGAFFAIWLVRVFVRLLFSHVHLATDAAERRMMILTYLSMAREGAQFAADDKKLIVQHIFRSASDGLVKDDAAPPTLFELLTRK